MFALAKRINSDPKLSSRDAGWFGSCKDGMSS